MTVGQVIDADAHVIESDVMWDCLSGADRQYRPTRLYAQTGPNAQRSYWIYDSNIQLKLDTSEAVSDEIRFLQDIPGRLAKMDEMGIDIQVIYPTVLLIYSVVNVAASVAICRCYNQYVADACASARGRLRWLIVPPAESMSDSLAELDYGAAHGACGVTLHGLEGQRTLADPYFFPLYEKAAALGLPICIHVGNGNIPMTDALRGSSLFFTRAPVLAAFHDLLIGGIPTRFPGLRFAFVEAGAEWIPWTISEVVRRAGWMISGDAKLASYAMGDEAVRRLKEHNWSVDPSRIMADNNLYVSCRIDDDLQYLVRWAGKSNLVTGTDYGHEDYSRELEAFKLLEDKKVHDHETIEGIRGRNAQRLYGL